MNKRLIIFTGAGISAESGVPTFRTGPDGLWHNHRIEDVCNIDTFEQNYDLVHEFYNARRTALQGVEPNAAHRAIARLQRHHGERVRLMTTNVDDLHERAGSPAVEHIHGNLLELVNLAEDRIEPIGYDAFDHAAHPPHFKPNVVFFGEVAPVYQDLFELMNSLSRHDLVLVIGSSESVVQFCLQAYQGSEGEARILYVDPSDTCPYERLLGRGLKPYTEHVRMGAVEALSAGSPVLAWIEEWLG
ncbi:SIR2 family NAD-dependent protein deacylase [Marinobacterium weihaiense]|uniref:protein acetyllysine N-acetyltransferase n=1 Tax=Marinobacterium weihaiense TaxID=2851016 RepID=A0ABS6MBX5_9GAMM|nr:Sir2 family NAD-dependent protein deacetylase [Marinobacterium weihaiense]MBV0933341.1 NAD-dependent deacylase [Marinobacterium weihaiense]